MNPMTMTKAVEIVKMEAPAVVVVMVVVGVMAVKEDMEVVVVTFPTVVALEPKEAIHIIVEDFYNVPEIDFCLLHTPVPLDEVNALSLFECFSMMQ